MDFYFFDSSAVVKNYVQETGTNWVKAIFNSTATKIIYVASITRVEVISAFTRRVKGKTLSAKDANIVSQQFKNDFAGDLRVLEITPDLLDEAVALTETHALRGYDAIQLASAVELSKEIVSLKLGTLIFVSADNELNSAAQAEGLKIENPNNYP
jgi:predicted nucleic acid-binding protein